MKIAGIELDAEEKIKIRDTELQKIATILFGKKKDREKLKESLDKGLEKLREHQDKVIDVLLESEFINKTDAKILKKDFATEYIHILLLAYESEDEREKLLFVTNNKELLEHQKRFNKKFQPKVTMLSPEESIQFMQEANEHMDKLKNKGKDTNYIG